MRIQERELRLEPLRETLRNHTLFTELSSLADVTIFIENHVYAVWDYSTHEINQNSKVLA